MIYKIEDDGKGWLINRWAQCVDANATPNLSLDMQERGKQIVTLFDNGMDLLRDPHCMPNLNINKLCTLGWRMIGNRITPVAITEKMPLGHPETLHFWCEMRGGNKLGFVMVPWEWPKMCQEDRNMQLGGLVFICSQIADYYHNVVGPKTVERSHCWEAEFLLTLQANQERFPLTLNEYQKETLRRYPEGLQSLPMDCRYTLESFKGNNDFKLLEAGECVKGYSYGQ
jgi:hypothetical protein